jgi:hypothetical protein
MSIGKREPMGFTLATLLDLADWLVAAGERANELLARKAPCNCLFSKIEMRMVEREGLEPSTSAL